MSRRFELGLDRVAQLVDLFFAPWRERVAQLGAAVIAMSHATRNLISASVSPLPLTGCDVAACSASETRLPQCKECGRVSGDRARLAGVPEDDEEPAEVVVYCPEWRSAEFALRRRIAVVDARRFRLGVNEALFRTVNETD